MLPWRRQNVDVRRLVRSGEVRLTAAAADERRGMRELIQATASAARG
jgi:hypothetical protein